MKGRVCQLFEVFQHEFANLSLPCEGRLIRCYVTIYAICHATLNVRIKVRKKDNSLH